MATREEVYAAIRKADAAGDGDSVRKLGAYLQTMSAPAPKVDYKAADPSEYDPSSQAYQDKYGATSGQSAGAKGLAGFGKFFSDIGTGAQQLGAGVLDAVAPRQQTLSGLVTGEPLSRVDQLRAQVAEQRKLDEPLMNTTAGKVGNFAGAVAGTIPALAIPGANSVAGAGLIGAGIGLLQPSTSTQETLTNTALSGALSAGGQYLGGKVSSAVSRRLSSRAAAAADAKSLNVARDAILQRGQQAGYVVPPTAVNGGATATALESISGKAAVRQVASIKNAQVTNRLIAEDLGLPANRPLTSEALAAVRKEAGKAYAAVARLPKSEAVPADVLSNRAAVDAINPAKMVYDLRQARNDASAWFKAYGRSASPDDLQKANAAKAIASKLETGLEEYATKMGRPDLVPAMVEARTLIAKVYAANSALKGGNINPAKYAKQFEDGKYLTGNTKLVAEFASNFPDVSKLPKSGAGVSKLAATVFGGGIGAAAYTGNPALIAGAAAATIGPYATRNALLSRVGQNMLATPNYTPGAIGTGTLNALDFAGRNALALTPAAAAYPRQ